ncbi:MAG: asparagine synthetase B, partial [Gemmatimonadaceae bacterium]
MRTTLVILCASLTMTLLGVSPASAQKLLVPMDDEQQNHLKAYGLTYNAIKAQQKAEWLLNYRGGAFLLPDLPELRRQAALDGITVEPVNNSRVEKIRAEMAGANMDAVPLEKAPKVAVYTPPDAAPWDDAVTLALKYAGIDYTPIYDVEVERGDLAKYDWLHLHHEDFTGQLNKFYYTYRDTPWYIEMTNSNVQTARTLGFATVPALKKDV